MEFPKKAIYWFMKYAQLLVNYKTNTNHCNYFTITVISDYFGFTHCCCQLTRVNTNVHFQMAPFHCGVITMDTFIGLHTCKPTQYTSYQLGWLASLLWYQLSVSMTYDITLIANQAIRNMSTLYDYSSWLYCYSYHKMISFIYNVRTDYVVHKNSFAISCKKSVN